MNRGDLEILGMSMSPGLKVSELQGGKVAIDSMMQKSADAVAYDTVCLLTDTKIDVIAGQQKYSMNTLLNRFCVMGPSGVWWNAGTQASTDYRPIYPKTLKWLDENVRNWRDRPGDAPIWSAIEGSDLIIYPKPASNLTNGFWIYYGQKAYKMTQDTDYPFYGASEWEHLSILDVAICLHFRWLAAIANNKETEKIEAAKADYDREIAKRGPMLRRDLSLQNSRYTKFMGAPVR